MKRERINFKDRIPEKMCCSRELSYWQTCCLGLMLREGKEVLTSHLDEDGGAGLSLACQTEAD